MKKYPQVLVNVHSDNKAGLDDCQPIWDAVAAAEKELDGRGRILVRPSGTEPLVRVMAEAETHELTQRVVDDIVEVVKRELPNGQKRVPSGKLLKLFCLIGMSEGDHVH